MLIPSKLSVPASKNFEGSVSALFSSGQVALKWKKLNIVGVVKRGYFVIFKVGTIEDQRNPTMAPQKLSGVSRWDEIQERLQAKDSGVQLTKDFPVALPESTNPHC